MYDRGDKYIELDQQTFKKIMYELKELGMDNANSLIHFSGFYEPMANIKLLKSRISFARNIMPNARYCINTNGDYVTKENLSGLYLDKLDIMDYDNKNMSEEELGKLGILIYRYNSSSGRKIGISKNIPLIVYRSNWAEYAHLEDRAGSLKEDIYHNEKKVAWAYDKAIRNRPCREPKLHPVIDCHGNLLPCCHFGNFIPQHRKYILGNVKKNTIKEILSSKKAQQLIKVLDSHNYNEYPEVCKYCNKYRIERDSNKTTRPQGRQLLC